MSFTERTAWAVFIMSTLYFAFSDGNCSNEEKGSFGIIGVFDFADVSSKEAFENAASRHNSKECVPKFIKRTLLIKNDSSVSELIDFAQNATETGPCFMVYATEDSKARIVLEFAITQGINVVTAISPVSMIARTFYNCHKTRLNKKMNSLHERKEHFMMFHLFKLRGKMGVF